jgi:lysyl-tRNA synthetase class 2
MIMTNSPSIQDVLFFPQMKPAPKTENATAEDYKAVGVREDLIQVVMKLGYLTIEELKKANANKLHNDVCGMRKKMKLENVKNPTPEEVAAWLA